MRDTVFFPIAAVLAGAFVFTALQPFVDRPPRGPLSGGGRNAEDVTVQGRELNRFLPGNYDGIRVITPPGATEPVLQITRTIEEQYGDPRSGPNIVLAEDLEWAFETATIEVVVEARSSSGDFPASQFETDYFARTEAESGWQKFDLTPEFKPYSFKYKVPARGPTEGYDYIGIRPVVPDKHRVMEVKSVRIHVTAAKSKDQAEPSPAGALAPPAGPAPSPPTPAQLPAPTPATPH